MNIMKIDSNSVLYKKVNQQIENLSKNGLYLDSDIKDLRRLAFAFPDISDGIANFTLEDSINRKNWGFAAFAYDNTDKFNYYYARCQSLTDSYEIIACPVEPGQYYIYNKGNIIANFMGAINAICPFECNKSTNFPIYIGKSLFGTIKLSSGLSIDSEVMFENDSFVVNLPIKSKDYRVSAFKEFWDTITLKWLDYGIDHNRDLIFPTKFDLQLNDIEEKVLFVILLLLRSFFVWKCDCNDYLA